MIERLRIAVAEDEPEVLADLRESLEDVGHEVIAAVGNGAELVAACREAPPDLVITDIKMPDMDGLEAAEAIRGIRPTPVVIVSAYHDQEFIDRAMKQHVLAYLIKPISEEALKASVDLAMQRFKEFQALQQQTADLQQALEDRKLIERAKGILMTRAELSEPDAFRRLQMLSSQKNKKMVQIARMIVEADEAFQG